MVTHATGTFEVKLTPRATDDEGESTPLGRLAIAKEFHGDLEGTSKGEMLTAGGNVTGSAGYSPSSGSRERCTGAAARSRSSTAAR